MPWITRTGRTYYGWQHVPSDELPSDRELKSVLVGRLRENMFTQDARIRVEVDRRVVVLGGEVDSPIANGQPVTTPGTRPVSST
jgi:hypothetical protein